MCRNLLSRSAVYLAAGVTLFAQSPAVGPVPHARITFRSGVDLVTLNVVVTDGRQQLVRDLGKRDFVVLEDGVAQPISFFASGTVPLDVVLLIDTSSSMGSLRPIVQRAARGFLRVLRPEDRGAVVGFNQRVTVLQDLTGDIDALDGAVRRAGADGDTALYASLYVTLRGFGRPARQTSAVRRQAIVMLSDGGENASAIGFDALEQAAQILGVSIYTIMFQDDDARARERLEGRLSPTRSSIRSLAIGSGAQAFFPDRADQLPGVYERIAAELSNQYSIAYAPPETGRAGSVRAISVRVPTHPALRARARTHYVPLGAVQYTTAMR